MIVLVGPTEVALRGYYRNNQFCGGPIEAVESIGLCVLPRAYPDGTNKFALQSFRVPKSIYEDDRLRVYGLVSPWSQGSSFDLSFSGSSSETSVLPPVSGDLPVSWSTWQADLAQALPGS